MKLESPRHSVSGSFQCQMSAAILGPHCLSYLTLVAALDLNKRYVKETGDRQEWDVGSYKFQAKKQKGAPTHVKKKAQHGRLVPHNNLVIFQRKEEFCC